MPQLQPVDSDPFAGLAPVEYDPFFGAPAPSNYAQHKFNKIADAVVGGLRNWIETPGRAMQEGITTGQAADWAAPTALGMMGVGAPNAMTGAVGTFGGRLAKTADHAALAKAEEMAAKGAGRDQIWNDTGWFQGPDQKWRYEISDATSQMNPNTYNGRPLPEFGRPSPVAGELWHPDLYAAYPELRATKARIEQGSNHGRYFPEGGEGSVPVIQVNATNPATARSVLLHELQHDLQAKEGFAKGADFEKVGMDKYVRSAGEQEAANVQRRLFMTPEERRATPPWTTETIPAEQQIVNMGYPGIVDILRKYGVGGLSMLPPATAAFLSDKIVPVDHDPFATVQ